MTIRKEIKFKDPKLAQEIQEYADIHFEGNFNMAVRCMCEKIISDSAKSEKKVDK